jgi:hypothetical protein
MRKIKLIFIIKKNQMPIIKIRDNFQNHQNFHNSEQ